MDKPRKKIAVYGTLKRGNRLHELLGENATFLGLDTIQGIMYEYSGSYPLLFTALDEEAGGTFSADLCRTHTLEVYEIDGDKFDFIRNMEVGAGYEEARIHTKYGHPVVFIAPPDLYDEDNCKWIEAF